MAAVASEARGSGLWRASGSGLAAVGTGGWELCVVGCGVGGCGCGNGELPGTDSCILALAVRNKDCGDWGPDILE